MSRFISPPRNQLDKLRQPLTDGERIVFELFDAHLPTEWEIYLQPHLNGLRPDFVLLNQNVGMAVFEVKDWDLRAMRYVVQEREAKPPMLIGEKDGKQFSLQSQNPIEKIYRYKKEIHELYCPRVDGKSGFATITAGVIFPFANDNDVKQLFSLSLKFRGMDRYLESYNPVVGANCVQAGDINSVFPESARKNSKYMSDDLAKDLRNWLVEPDFSKTQRQPLELDKTQLSYVKSRTDSGYRRIKGAAGSGKSLILAARAAELLHEGKEVLVITFNITLIHYLKDISVRWGNAGGKARGDITWLNFHFWCKKICEENDYEEEYINLWRDKQNINQALNSDLPNLVSHILDEKDNVSAMYDAVFVDEGQDILPNWWNVLRKVCKEGGEMLLVADATQDIYGTARSWTDETMKGAGFSGGWAELKISYRLPQLALDYASKFAQEFLPNDMVDLPISAQGELSLFPCTLKWVQTRPEMITEVCRQELFLLAVDTEPDFLSIAEITFLSDTKKSGQDVIEEVNKRRVRAVHTFAKDPKESRRQKVGFYMGDSRIKATTLHSFKGWESRAIVICIGQQVDKKSLALIYTGLTRLKRHTEGSYLTVVSCADELLSYGKTWPKYVEKLL